MKRSELTSAATRIYGGVAGDHGTTAPGQGDCKATRRGRRRRTWPPAAMVAAARRGGVAIVASGHGGGGDGKATLRGRRHLT
uniref:DUF834 domain-containing protein n=1 Tax=Oryza meridionalis TaxID=40149 RepID=A0A0E0C0W0_9ORYZ